MTAELLSELCPSHSPSSFRTSFLPPCPWCVSQGRHSIDNAEGSSSHGKEQYHITDIWQLASIETLYFSLNTTTTTLFVVTKDNPFCLWLANCFSHFHYNCKERWMFFLTHPKAGGDKGLGEAWAECSVLLPDWERGFVQRSSLQSDLSATGSGPVSCPGRPRPVHFQSHPDAQEEDRTEDTSSCWLCCLPLGHQGGKGRHVRLVIHSFLFFCCMKFSQDRRVTQHMTSCDSTVFSPTFCFCADLFPSYTGRTLMVIEH